MTICHTPCNWLTKTCFSRAATLVLLIFQLFASVDAYAQCCAGGSGSPIAGGTSQGVLANDQFEMSTLGQWAKSSKFFAGSSPSDLRTFDQFESLYQYFRLAYGLTRNLTMSVEGGYYHFKKETGLDHAPASTFSSQGWGDILLFPRYNVFNWTNERTRTELTLGLGFKIPLGSYNATVDRTEPFSGETYSLTKPTAVQLSSGAQDLLFYGFFFREYTPWKLRMFTNAIYIRKGYNPNGEKLGNFASLSVFTGTTVLKSLNINIEGRYEWMDHMDILESTLLYGSPSNYFPEATGYRKIILTPQVSLPIGRIIAFGSMDIPLYQHLNTSPFYAQVGTHIQATLGISYRFFGHRPNGFNDAGLSNYDCPMHPDIVGKAGDACPLCGMALEKAHCP